MKILVKAVAGSHLFGTNTPTSDQDFKGVFLPTKEEILLGHLDKTVHQHTNNTNQKNTGDDIDVEFYSLDKFLKMLYQGQTVAWELLFTPENLLIEQHPLWKSIKDMTPLFLNKKISAFIGYTKTQADRYGIRGSRLETIEKTLDFLNQFKAMRLIDPNLREVNLEEILKLEHVEMIRDKNGKELLQVCGKKFGLDTKISYVIPPIKNYYDTYGERSRLAKMNLGVDFKALSHSVRVSMQAYSLITEGKILLPMSEENVKLLKNIKSGKYPYVDVAEMIEEHLDKVIEAQKVSPLPEEPDLETFKKVQIDIYEKIVRGEV